MARASEIAPRTKIALIQALMSRIHPELFRLSLLNANAGQGMSIDEVATVLAVTDATIGILCAIRGAPCEPHLDGDALEQEMEGYLMCDRMEAGGVAAARMMEGAFNAPLTTLAATTLTDGA
jgi:hypothetical protein